MTTSTLQSRLEKTLATSQLSGAAGSTLFDAYLDHSRIGFEANVIPLLFQSTQHLRNRFEAVGQQLTALEPYDQLRCRLIFASSFRRLGLTVSPTDGKSSSTQVLESAQQLADTAGIWRIPTHQNFTNLLLLYTLVANGDLTSPEADHYLSAACSQFRHIFVLGDDDLVKPVSSSRGWGAYTLAISDLSAALERRTAPYLSDREFSLFTRNREPYYLPAPDSLRRFIPHALSKLVDQCIHPMTYYLRLARTLAIHFSLEVDQQDDNRLLSAFDEMDAYRVWWQGCMTVLRSQPMSVVFRATAESAITLNYVLGLMLEFSTRDYLSSKLEKLSLDLSRGGMQSVNLPAAPPIVSSLLAISESRCARALALFLRQTRKRNGFYLLVASVGCLCSVNQFNALAATLCESSPNNYELFPLGPLDKLASVTFLAKTLENAQGIYPSANLGASIANLKSVQRSLEIESTYSGEMALILVVSISSDQHVPDSTFQRHLPDTPSAMLVLATELIARGGDPHVTL
ncbi:hypothetical protein JCM16303_000371 [Sporobolomyces ruberrimus]